jgi:Ca2+/H+ antiporter
MALLDNVVDITVFIGALALLIMSSIILGSANKIEGASNETGATEAQKKQYTVKRDIKKTSTLLLIISIIVFVLYGYKLYQTYMSGKESKGSVTYFF